MEPATATVREPREPWKPGTEPADEPAERLTDGGRSKKLLDLVRLACQLRHYSYHTEQTYCGWVKRFCRFHRDDGPGGTGRPCHPATMREPEVVAFLTHLAVDRHVVASTQNQALAALLFLYDAVLGEPLGDLHGDLGGSPDGHPDGTSRLVWAKRPKRLPVVLTREVRTGPYRTSSPPRSR